MSTTAARRGLRAQRAIPIVRRRCGPRTAFLVEDRDGVFRLHLLEGRNFFVGRAEACQLRIDEPEISRHHAIIRCHDDRYEVFDCASTNGLRVNGRIVRAQVLADGDVMAFGRWECRFQLLRGPGDRP